MKPHSFRHSFAIIFCLLVFFQVAVISNLDSQVSNPKNKEDQDENRDSKNNTGQNNNNKRKNPNNREDRDRKNQIIENKWNLKPKPTGSYGDTHLLNPGRYKDSDSVKIPPVLQSFIGQESKTIGLDYENHLNLGNLTFAIGPEHFKNKKQVEVRVRDLNEPIDFFLAGIDMSYYDKGRFQLFESAGMFHVEFRDKRGKRLEPDKPIPVYRNGYRLGLEPGFYRLKSDRWAITQSKEETKNRPSEGMFEEIGQTGIASELIGMVGSSGWWNFDVPNIEYTCIQFSKSKKEEMSVMAIGLKKYGMSYSIPNEDNVRITILRNTSVKILAYKETQDRIFYAVSDTLLTPDKQGFAGDLKSYCKSIGQLNIQSIPKPKSPDKKFYKKLFGL